MISLILMLSVFNLSSEVIKYTVKNGDTLWSISSRFLGNGDKWKIIYCANKDKIKDPNLIVTSTVIDIPIGIRGECDDGIEIKFEDTKDIENGVIIETVSVSTFSIEIQSQSAPFQAYKTTNDIMTDDFIEIDRRNIYELPISLVGFDTGVRRFKIKKDFVIAEVLGDSLYFKGDVITAVLIRSDVCGRYNEFRIFKLVKKTDDYFIGDDIGVCEVEGCFEDMVKCKIVFSMREVSSKDILVLWKKKN